MGHTVQLVDNGDIGAIVLELPEQTKPCLQDREGCRFLFVKGGYQAWQKKERVLKISSFAGKLRGNSAKVSTLDQEIANLPEKFAPWKKVYVEIKPLWERRSEETRQNLQVGKC